VDGPGREVRGGTFFAQETRLSATVNAAEAAEAEARTHLSIVFRAFPNESIHVFMKGDFGQGPEHLQHSPRIQADRDSCVERVWRDKVLVDVLWTAHGLCNRNKEVGGLPNSSKN